MLLERDAQLALVETALHAAVEGTSSLILLSGPVGIGRTALLRRLPRLVTGQDVRVLRANAGPMEQDFAFGVVRQLCDELLAGLPEQARERSVREYAVLERVFADDDMPGGLPAADSQAVLHDLRTLFVNAGADTPLLILVDDLQWADTPSLRWFAYLAKRLRGLRIVLVYTVREGDPGAQHPLIQQITDFSAHVLLPGPLSLDGTSTVILNRFGEPGDEEFVRACHETSTGNPLFLMSVLFSMPSGTRPTADAADVVRSLLPAQLRDRLAACLHSLPQPIQALAAAIAAVGEHEDPRLVARLAGLDEIGYAAGMRTLYQFGVLAGEHRPRFSHFVVRDAVESSLTMVEREQLHDRAAALLYGQGHPAEHVAAQLMTVGTSSRPWSVSVLRAAADTALRRGAPDTAARYLRRALLDSPAQSEERAWLLIELATAERAFDPAACERHISQAVPLLTTARDRAVATLRAAPTFWGTTSPSFIQLLREVAEELGPLDSLVGSAHEIGLRLEARLRYYDHECPSALSSAVERLHGLGKEPPLQSGAERELLAVLLHAGTLTCRLPAADAALLAGRILDREPATSARPPYMLPLLATTLIAADSLQDVDSWLSLGQRLGSEKSGIDGELLHALRAMVLTARGQVRLAREHAERAVHLTEAESPEVRANFAIALATVALEVRDLGLSEQILTAADRQPSKSLSVSAILQILKASTDVQRGDLAGALDGLLACGRQVERSGWRNSVLLPWRPWAISLNHRLGASHAARALAEEEHAQAMAWGAPAMLGRALRLKGMVLGGIEGVALLREAVDVLRNSDNQLELARALVLLGRMSGDDAEAAAAIREGGEHAVACGAPRLTERAQQGHRAPATRTAVLTRAERRVGELAARGLTNQEIADELGVTSRAIEKHLTNSYRKLGVSGRSKLIEALTTLV
ncbi:ATP-binding protein [Nonomuraea sp. NPDC049480]|uniref:ATP-binding protein n=1 Tax=Nonomuraea sp. NPDC049480 TaxID=3364353 RepID=UPI0037A93F3C